MDATTFKQKIANGLISDEDLAKILNNQGPHSHKGKGNYLKNILDGFSDAYTKPNLWRAVMDTVLIFCILTGVVVLCFAQIMDVSVGGFFLASILGFLFGKMKK